MRKINRAAGTVFTAATLAALLPALAGCATQPLALTARVAAAGQPSSAPAPAAGAVAAPVAATTPTTEASTTAAGPTPTQSPAPATTELTLATAKKMAAAGILTDDDLPGYTSAPRPDQGNATGADTLGRLASCLGLSSTEEYLWGEKGTEFKKGTTTIDSSADVAATAAQARSDLTAIGGTTGAGCFRSMLTETLASSGITVNSASVRVLPIPVDGADDSFVQELSLVVQAPGHAPVSATVFHIGALIGQAEVDLLSVATGPAMPSSADSLALARTAAARVRSVQNAS
jgi:hypothetical protein